jgi:hypothetical protein
VQFLQRNIELSELRNEEMALLNQEASKPFLRQIESMRELQNRTKIDWEYLEKGFKEKIEIAEKEAITFREKSLALETKLADFVSVANSAKQNINP